MIWRFGFDRRKHFGAWLNDRNLTGEAVEVGTHRGAFAAMLLKHWRGRKLTCVDHYPADYDADDPICKAGAPPREQDRLAALLILREFDARRWHLLELPSLEAAGRFADASLDFVYIDAKHRTTDVLRDLLAWWPKLRAGGVMAGHDVVCPAMEQESTDVWGPEVQTAIERFARGAWIAEAFFVTEPEEGWSFYFFKP